MSIVMRPNQSWLGAHDLIQIARAVISEVNSPSSSKLVKAIDSNDHVTLVNTSSKPDDFDDVMSFRRDYQVVSLLKKASWLSTGIDKRLAALETFEGAERQCGSTNERLESLCYGTAQVPESVPAHIFRCLMRAKDIVSVILGEYPPSSLVTRFGPGVTSLVKGSVTTPRKYSDVIHVTPELYPYWRDVAGPNWCSNIKEVWYESGSRIAFVPKNGKTDRTIGIEPHLNIYAQLGVGAAMRERFRPWIDLNVGQSRNRYLAMIAQSTGLATIDFSSASDTVSSGIVELLLPPAWVTLLNRVRSHRYILTTPQGEVERAFNKHSSMGNGYTFELESIIFYALARACCWDGNTFAGANVSAYGDDVILPAQFASLFIEVSEFAGFSVNRDKSFTGGSFFESCGHDYYHGRNVRPFFWKDNGALTGFKVYNDVMSMADNLELPKLKQIAAEVFAKAPRSLQRCLIPKGYGDVGFIVGWDQALPAVKRARNGWCGFSTKALKFRPDRKLYGTSRSGLLAALDMKSMMSSAPVRGAGTYQVEQLTTFGSWDAA